MDVWAPSLDLAGRMFDLVWCENAVYTVGFDAALRAARLPATGSFTLPDGDWEDGYYAELGRRIPALRARHPEPEARAVLVATEEEIAVFRERERSFEYVFHVVRTRGAPRFTSARRLDPLPPRQPRQHQPRVDDGVDQVRDPHPRRAVVEA